uniref:Uncharacterized protein n=1 Tax=Leersia perrieri TaxID=77586 RepID=A0A0D9W481_9ORYZ
MAAAARVYKGEEASCLAAGGLEAGRRKIREGDQNGEEEWSGGAAADRGPVAARDLLPEEACRDGEEGGGARRALRCPRRLPRHRRPPPPPLRRSRHFEEW